jgi:Flp pilus assembly pilin Flp
MSLVKQFAADTRGATAIEYALVAGLIFLVVVTAISAIGPATARNLALVLPGFH